MHTICRASVTIALLALAACTGPAPLRGTWEGRAGDERVAMVLTQDGDRVSGDGTYSTADYYGAFRVAGTVVGGRFALRLVSEEPEPLTLVGRIVGDSLRASLDSPEARVPIVLTRAR